MENYKRLNTYVLATVIFDLTDSFCKKYISYKSRTNDQMVQAARSGKQNIAEGYSLASTEGYIKLLGVAKASFKELSADYEDYLRQNKLTIWIKDDPRIRAFRDFRASWIDSEGNYPNTPKIPNSPEEFANMLLTFCQMETYMLYKQGLALEEKFAKEGGFSENLFQKRLARKYSSF